MVLFRKQPDKANLLSHCSLSGLMDAFAQRVFHFNMKQPMLGRGPFAFTDTPPVLLRYSLIPALVIVVLCLLAAHQRIRAVEIVKG